MTRLRQAGVLAAAAAVAAVMVLAGVWQFGVYRSQAASVAAQRAAAPPVPLPEVAAAGVPVRDGYGRTVTVTGTYLADRQLLVRDPDGTEPARVLTALRQRDGSTVPVVRGATREAAAPAPPTGPVTVVGVFLPSEDTTDRTGTTGLGSVRVAALAQRWPPPLVAGFVTVPGSSAEAAGLLPVAVDLPAGRGRLRNGAYALQWWVFAAFTLAFGVRVARDLGRGREPGDPAPGADAGERDPVDVAGPA